MRWAASIDGPVPDYPLTYDGVKQLIAAAADPDFSVMWAGEGAHRARSLPAADLVRQLHAEMAPPPA
jgi:nitronate monooxygenase